jgi:hypothetical protein
MSAKTAENIEASWKEVAAIVHKRLEVSYKNMRICLESQVLQLPPDAEPQERSGKGCCSA